MNQYVMPVLYSQHMNAFWGEKYLSLTECKNGLALK